MPNYIFQLKASDFFPPVLVRSFKRLFKSFLPKYSENITYKYSGLNTYAQYQEDLILDLIFNFKPNGKYIDVGANNPINLSNTKRFYDRGWFGINIEPNPMLINNFKKERIRDINLNVGIAPKKGLLKFFEMSEDTLSTFDKKTAIWNGKAFNVKIVSESMIPVVPLQEIYESHFANEEVDFLSIDVEGFDLEVLKSNCWEKYRPKVILIEIYHGGNIIEDFLDKVNYFPVFKNPCNGIFLDKKLKNIFDQFGHL